MTELGNKIRSLRTEHGMTAAQLGERLGLKQSAVSHLENGLRLPSFGVLVKLANVFDVSTDELTSLSTEQIDSIHEPA